jgi:hypothetical protein
VSGRALRPGPDAILIIERCAAQLFKPVRDRGQIAAQLARAFERVYDLTSRQLARPQPTPPPRGDVVGDELAEPFRDRLRADGLAELPPAVLVDAHARHAIARGGRAARARPGTLSRPAAHPTYPAVTVAPTKHMTHTSRETRDSA